MVERDLVLGRSLLQVLVGSNANKQTAKPKRREDNRGKAAVQLQNAERERSRRPTQRKQASGLSSCRYCDEHELQKPKHSWSRSQVQAR